MGQHSFRTHDSTQGACARMFSRTATSGRSNDSHISSWRQGIRKQRKSGHWFLCTQTPQPSSFHQLSASVWQIQNPSNQYETYKKSISSSEYSFEAKQDGKYTYCFSNEHWSANSKEVSFNVHGIVYVSEQDAPSDPLEKEGAEIFAHTCNHLSWRRVCSETSLGASVASQGWADIYCGEGEDTQKYSREHECKGKMVECFSVRCIGGNVYLSGVVVEEVLWGTPSSSNYTAGSWYQLTHSCEQVKRVV